MTTKDVDALLIVVGKESAFPRFGCEIDALTETLRSRIHRKYIVANLVRIEDIPRIRERISGFRVEYLYSIPYDEEIEAATNNGNPVTGIKAQPVVESNR